jgi:membrane dipeptidase
VLIVDAHLDLAWNALQWGRDLRTTVAEIRATEIDLEGPGRGRGTVGLPELAAAPVAVAVVTLLARCTGTPVTGLDYATVAEAGKVAREQLAFYRALEDEQLATIIVDAAGLEVHLGRWAAWEAEPAGKQPPLGVVLSMEGADPIATPDELPCWHAAGLRLIGLAHYGHGRYAGGTLTDGGLTDLGRSLLGAMAALGMMLDLTHCTDAGIDEALAHFEGPILASHSNVRALVPRQRQLPDRHIEAIAARGGVIGVGFDCWMLDPDWVHGQPTNPVTMSRVVDHIESVCQLTGSAAHVGIGSDLDGGFGAEQSPRDLDTIADLRLLVSLLYERGYTEADVEAIMHGNWLRLLGSSLPES